jgi:hypothetical protein
MVEGFQHALRCHAEGLAGARGRRHDVVITVATSRWLECVGRYERAPLLEQPTAACTARER